MNYPMICQILARVTIIEAGLFLLPAGVSVFYGEKVDGFLIAGGIALAASILFFRIRPKENSFFLREGFASVTLAWIVLSLIGAIPYVVNGNLTYVDALFENISGFTTSGASILTNGVESLDRGLLFWRSLTCWIGGMGVLIFMMAVIPMTGKYSMHIMRAEFSGPSPKKLAPHMQQTSMLLYLIYIALTLMEIILLKIGGMSLYDAVVHAFGTASTGGCSSYNLGIAHFNSLYVETVIGIFMIIFGINFHLYYFILLRKFKVILRSEELWWFLGIIAFATLSIAGNIYSLYGSFPVALRYSFFQSASLASTAAYVSTDYAMWPAYSQWVLLFLMFIGGCAGSTSSGIKFARFLILVKISFAQIKRFLRPHSFIQVQLNNSVVDRETIQSTLVYVYMYFLIGGLMCLILSFENFDFATTATCTIACLSNTGLGLSMIGPYGSFADFSNIGKLVLSLAMLLGRLEIYPVLLTLFGCLRKRK